MKKSQSISKKRHLAKAGRRTNWAPFWLIPKIFGQGKRVHPARITRLRRSWRRTKLKIGPRKTRHPEIG